MIFVKDVRALLNKLIKRKFLNNKWINPILYHMKLDAYLNDLSQDYLVYKPNESKSLQEIAGYSNTVEINETMQSIHRQLIECVTQQQKRQPSDTFQILDIGCGPGLFLMNFKGTCELHGIDINKGMCDLAKTNLPEARIIKDHFLKHQFKEKFNVIYSIGVLIYFSRSQVKDFFNKIHQLLKTNGIVFISYPHAFRKEDLSYHDYTYVHYSPLELEGLVGKDFKILYHSHQNKKRKVTDYDHEPILNQFGYDGRSYVNSSIMIIEKR